MRKLNNARIEYHTSKYCEYEGYRTSDWIESYSDVTIRELFDYAYSEIECSTFEATEQGLRILFKHGSFDVADRLSRFIERQKQI